MRVQRPLTLSEPALKTVEQAGNQHLITPLGVFAGQRPQVRGDAPDRMENNQAAAPRIAWRFAPGVEGEAVPAAGQADGLTHRRVPWSGLVEQL